MAFLQEGTLLGLLCPHVFKGAEKTLCPLLTDSVNLALSTLHITVDSCIRDDVHSVIFWK